MDDWRERLASELVGGAGATGASGPPSSSEGIVALEIVIGHARSEMTFVLELGRAHGLPVTGSIFGDDVWVRIGATTLRFNLSRRAGVIVTSVVGRGDSQLKWSPERRSVVDPEGAPLDAISFVRGAVDATVGAWKASGHPQVTISALKARPREPTLPDSSEILPKS